MAHPSRYDDVAIGDSIPPFTAPAVSRLQLALFAGAAADHNPIHVDGDAARGGGLPGVIAHGMLLTRWTPQRNIRALSSRFVAMAFPGDVITCTGTVAAKSVQDGEKRVELDLAAQNQNGEKVLLGKAMLALP